MSNYTRCNMSFYHVYTKTLHIDIVKAYNEEHAVKLVEMLYGPASKYHTSNKYEAVKA